MPVSTVFSALLAAAASALAAARADSLACNGLLALHPSQLQSSRPILDTKRQANSCFFRVMYRMCLVTCSIKIINKSTLWVCCWTHQVVRLCGRHGSGASVSGVGLAGVLGGCNGTLLCRRCSSSSLHITALSQHRQNCRWTKEHNKDISVLAVYSEVKYLLVLSSAGGACTPQPPSRCKQWEEHLDVL